MEKTILFTEGEYSIQKQQGIPEEAFEFLDSIAWGNEGALYEHKNTKEHIRLLYNPMLISINEGDKIQGTAAFCNTDVTVNGSTYNCFYIRYFASSKEIRGKGVMKHFSRKVMELIRDDEKAKTIYFACIESANKSSYRVVESAGYTPMGRIKTMGFSRYFPKVNKNLIQVTTASDKQQIMDLLKEQYQHHALVQFNAIFLQDNYYMIKEQGEIVAACQYHRAHWVINAMKGFLGKIIMNVVPLIPIINQLFNPKKFEFLAFEGIYFKPGYEHQLYQLFEGLLAKEKLKSGMFWLGETCPVREKILQKGQLGLIHSFIKDSDIIIMGSYKNMSDAEIKQVEKSPLYGSAFDFV